MVCRGRRRPRRRAGLDRPRTGRARGLVPMAPGAFCVTHCCSAGLLTRPDSAYRLVRAATGFSVIVARTGRGVGAAFSGLGDLTGVDVQTFPGGGEPSAVKSEFCSASVFAMGTGLTTGFFIPMTFAVRGSAACRAVRDRRLSHDAHDVHHSGLAWSTSWPAMIGSRTRTSCKSTAREHTAAFRDGACRRTPTRGQTSERP